MLKRFLATLTLVALPVFAFAADPVEGKDYTVLPSPGTVEVPGKVEVREFFWYGCPHCFRLDPFIESWLATKPANVNFIRTPAAMNPDWEVNARGFYVAQMLGLEDKTHVAMFNAIHKDRQQLFSEGNLASFYAAYGVPASTFEADYNSFAVIGKIAQSKQLAQQYGLDGVPALIVNGKYKVGGETGHAIEVVNFLVAKERALLPKPAPAPAATHKKTHKKAASAT
jgi:thiol:disulfide interchange protein DsbA